MAYHVGKGNEVTILHVVRDINGDPVPSKASELSTTLYKPDGDVSSLTVTATDIGTTGFVSLKFTPDQTGNWLLQVTNPSGTDEGTYTYTAQVSSAAEVLAETSGLLTTLARVKERLNLASSNTTWDDLLNSLISEISNKAKDITGRVLTEATYTEYYDGTGTDTLYLRQGPLVSVSSVYSVSYGSDGAGGRSESTSLLDPSNYVLDGLRDENWRGCGKIRLLGGTWTEGVRNWKVTYTAGYDTVPESLVHFATNWVVSAFLTRECFGLVSKVIGDGSITPMPLDAAEAMFRLQLAPYAKLPVSM